MRKIVICQMFKSYLILFLFFCSIGIFAQPFTDIVSISSQYLPTTYKDSLKSRNVTKNNIINILVPLRLDSQNTFIARFYGEELSSTIQNKYYTSTSDLYSAFAALGLQHESQNKKWKYLGLIIPKLSSDFKDQVSGYDTQIGGYGLVTYTVSATLKFKAGLFYNREFFGNFFVPLIGMDWKPTERFRTYGVLPTNYRLEYALLNHEIYGGLGFKSFTRTYRLNSDLNNDLYRDYVRNDEIQIKLFLDFYFHKIVFFGEFGRTLGYSPLAYVNATETLSLREPIYTAINDNFFFNIGIAYRIRTD